METNHPGAPFVAVDPCYSDWVQVGKQIAAAAEVVRHSVAFDSAA